MGPVAATTQAPRVPLFSMVRGTWKFFQNLTFSKTLEDGSGWLVAPLVGRVDAQSASLSCSLTPGNGLTIHKFVWPGRGYGLRVHNFECLLENRIWTSNPQVLVAS